MTFAIRFQSDNVCRDFVFVADKEEKQKTTHRLAYVVIYETLDLSSSSSSLSSVDVNSGFEDTFLTVLKQFETEEEEENENAVRFSFLLGKHRDRHLDIVGNEIILLSKRQPIHSITFTVKRWAHLIGWLNDFDAQVKKPSPTRRTVPLRRPLGDNGYYVRVFHTTRRVDFCRFFCTTRL